MAEWFNGKRFGENTIRAWGKPRAKDLPAKKAIKTQTARNLRIYKSVSRCCNGFEPTQLSNCNTQHVAMNETSRAIKLPNRIINLRCRLFSIFRPLKLFKMFYLAGTAVRVL